MNTLSATQKGRLLVSGMLREGKLIKVKGRVPSGPGLRKIDLGSPVEKGNESHYSEYYKTLIVIMIFNNTCGL